MSEMSEKTADPRARPRHVGIIMDGNGRWAESRGLPRLEGHRAGADSVRDAAAGKLSPAEVDGDRFGGYLPTVALPPLDLLIRTSGEQRISNFMLWEIAYAELMFVDVLWPEFRRQHLFQCLEQYAMRERRFGRTAAQLLDSDVEESIP